MARLVQQHNSADGHERPQHCWATLAMDAPDVPPPVVKNITPVQFMLAAVA